MIAKIMKGSGFKGVINYILDPKKGTELIDSSGVRIDGVSHIIQSFIDQTNLNQRVSKVVGHISLSFSAQDSSRLSNEWMAKVARENMEKMGIKDTQYIIGRHFDKEHPHVHIAFNRIDNNGKTISDRNDRFRSEKICKELTTKYGLYFADGKEKVKEYRLKEPDKSKYEIYQALKTEIARCRDWKNLLVHLKKQDIDVRFKFKSNSQEVQGIIFEKNGYHFNGSKVDRGFSYSKIDFALCVWFQLFQDRLCPATEKQGTRTADTRNDKPHIQCCKCYERNYQQPHRRRIGFVSNSWYCPCGGLQHTR